MTLEFCPHPGCIEFSQSSSPTMKSLLSKYCATHEAVHRAAGETGARMKIDKHMQRTTQAKTERWRMSWARGKDSTGRDIGYAIEATCEHPRCKAKIDRGLAYKCGGEPGSYQCCEGYFCEKHRKWHRKGGSDEDRGAWVCLKCHKELSED